MAGAKTIGLISPYNVNQSFPGPGAQGPRRPLFAINPLVKQFQSNLISNNSFLGLLQNHYSARRKPTAREQRSQSLFAQAFAIGRIDEH